jgi:hypothetical protein
LLILKFVQSWIAKAVIVHLPKICFQAHDTEEMSAPICDAGLDGYFKADSAFDVLVDRNTKKPAKNCLSVL